jgi:hypothetical protein
VLAKFATARKIRSEAEDIVLENFTNRFPNIRAFEILARADLAEAGTRRLHRFSLPQATNDGAPDDAGRSPCRGAPCIVGATDQSLCRRRPSRLHTAGIERIMRFYFTEEDAPTRERATDIRAPLTHARHEVIHGRPGDPPPAGIDAWFHGLGIEGSPPMDEAVVTTLIGSPASVVLFQLCDGESMSFDRIPASLAARTRLFLRNHWPSDKSRIPEQFRGRLGFLPPMVKPMSPDFGTPLAARSHGAIFFGARTGFENMEGGGNAREEVVRRLRASTLPFTGGIVPHPDPRYLAAQDVLVERISGRDHDRLLRDTKICLAPWGHHPITYRLFEGLSRRCLVVAQTLDGVSFLDCGLEAGRHYVRVSADLRDLVEVVGYYLDNIAEAQRIADAGHENFCRFFAGRGRLPSASLFEAAVASWGELYRPSEASGPRAALQGVAARLFPRWF